MELLGNGPTTIPTTGNDNLDNNDLVDKNLPNKRNVRHLFQYQDILVI